MKAPVILGLLAAATVIAYITLVSQKHPEISEEAYDLYKLRFGKSYSADEHKYRLGLFRTFHKKMMEHNSQETTWKMGINQFSDLTQEEFVQNYLGQLPPSTQNKDYDRSVTVGSTDWVAAGAITAIKNQGSCGSCWAFSATASHESYQILKKKAPQSIHLSPQQLVDCATGDPYNNNGCGGGYAAHGLEYIKDNGQTTEQSYPYKAKNQECSAKTGSYQIFGVAEITGCTNMENGLTSTPMSVRVDASNWHSYKSGIFKSCGENHNHAVQLVGSTPDYWKIKNSWDTTWGEQGYIRLAKGNTCGVCFGPSFPF